MHDLYLLNENITNGFNSLSLNFITFAAILCGIFVIVSKNPIVSVLFLIGLFLCISIYLMLLGMNFLGLSYLLVYVGAVSILFLFILMLINVRISEIVSATSNSIPLAIFIGTLFFSTVYQALPLSAGQALSAGKPELASNVILQEIKNLFFNLSTVFEKAFELNISDVNLSKSLVSEIQPLSLVSSQT
ncbi:MAG: hypothetical protein EOP34_03330 [Rickettsiales bacterium]|nr:MAG: hypothetical protein EOP34_03330 [Rickettsiales bacterium]